MTKKEMTTAILAAKSAKGVTWETLGTKTGLNPVCIASACLGSATLSEAEALVLAETLSLSDDVRKTLMEYPTKGEGQVVPSDPLLYRFFEIVYIYGPSIKEIIHEKFGDGIMSAIDFTLDIDKVEDPKGDRVKVTMNGKFLPYKKW